MAYTKTNWQARQGADLNRFAKSGETAASVVLTPNPGTVTVAGTPFTPANMNHIEDGIAAAHEGIASEAAARQSAIAAEQNARAGAIASEAAARAQADDDLRLAINILSPENVSGLPELLAAKQDKIAATGASNLLTAPASAGGQPGTMAASGFVQTSGAQTIAGVKTFSSIPVLPASGPSSANEAARKAYVDAEASARQAADQALQQQITAAAGVGSPPNFAVGVSLLALLLDRIYGGDALAGGEPVFVYNSPCFPGRFEACKDYGDGIWWGVPFTGSWRFCGKIPVPAVYSSNGYACLVRRVS